MADSAGVEWPGRRARRSVFALPRMDCAAEEQLVRLALEGLPQTERLSFDLARRTLVAWHAGEPETLLSRLEPLRLGARLVESALLCDSAGSSEPLAPAEPSAPEDPEARARSSLEAGSEARTLWTVLAVNLAMFVVEAVAGWLAQSTGLLADSLDMLADAAVYGLGLYAVGRPAALKLRAAHVCGWLQLVLGAGALAEVARRAVVGSEPEPPAMVGISVLALAANVLCLLLVFRQRHAGAHMTASVICSANDVLANVGVIAAGALVAWTGSALPDLAIGALIASLVLAGALRILRLR